VMSYFFGGGVAEAGIDLGHRTPLRARGAAHSLLIDDTPALPMDVRVKQVILNLAIICAGPACDVRFTAKSLEQSLRDQWSDHKNAVMYLSESPLIDRSGEDEGKAEMAVALLSGLRTADAQLARPEVWASVEAVSKAVHAAEGKLPGREIVSIIEAMKEANGAAT
jgi:hypothetical protein